MSHRELCRICGGNGVIKIPGGVSVCDHCNGDCYEPRAASASVSPDLKTNPVHERLKAIAHSLWARGREGAAATIEACVRELERRTGCDCACCDHAESSDCGCHCHATGKCAAVLREAQSPPPASQLVNESRTPDGDGEAAKVQTASREPACERAGLHIQPRAGSTPADSHQSPFQSRTQTAEVGTAARVKAWQEQPSASPASGGVSRASIEALKERAEKAGWEYAHGSLKVVYVNDVVDWLDELAALLTAQPSAQRQEEK